MLMIFIYIRFCFLAVAIIYIYYLYPCLSTIVTAMVDDVRLAIREEFDTRDKKKLKDSKVIISKAT